MYFFKRRQKDGLVPRSTPQQTKKVWLAGEDGYPPGPVTCLKDMSPEKQEEMYRLYGNGPTKKK